MNSGGVQSGTSIGDGTAAVFELRQVRLPAEWSPWQRAIWLDSQSLLWGELGILLDGDGGVVESGADVVSNAFAEQSNAMTAGLVRGGDLGPDGYVEAVNALAFRVSTTDTPDPPETNLTVSTDRAAR